MGKTLILYFSVYGTSKKFAEEIGRQTGADLRAIEPAQAYDSNREHYQALADFAQKEHDEDRRPAIKEPVDVSAYDVVFVGYPMWWYTFPMILYTLFDQVDFAGKTLVPFNTHMGSGDGGTYRTIRQLAPQASVLEGLPLSMDEAETGSPRKVAAWLDRIGLAGPSVGGTR